MSKKLLYIGGGVIVVLLLIYSLFIIFSPSHVLPGMQGTNTSPTLGAGGLYSPGLKQNSNSQTTGSPQGNTSDTNQTSQITPTKVKFDTSTYKPLSQQVYPGPLSNQSTITLDGTTISAVHQSNGSTSITLHINHPGYQDVVVTAPSGYTVYYTYLSYPTPSTDYGDVGLILVDPEGNIVPE